QICADALGTDYRRGGGGGGETGRVAFGLGGVASRGPAVAGGGTPRAAPPPPAPAGLPPPPPPRPPAARPRRLACPGVRGSAATGPSMTLGEIAKALEPSSRLRGAHTPGLAADGWFYTDHMNYPYGVHAAVARVDRETGGVTIERFLVAYDIGRAVNPMLV